MKSRAFTIVELLIIMGIIAILIGLVVVGLHSMQTSAARTESINALRQMVAGYVGYSTDNRNHLMPGYVDFSKLPAGLIDPTADKHLVFNAKLGERWMFGHDAPATNRTALQSYVWRLAPYVDHNWKTMMVDYREPGAVRHLQGTYDQAFSSAGKFTNPNSLLEISMRPAYGLNSIFLGGDNFHGKAGFAEAANPWANYPNPNYDKVAATRMTEVCNPSSVIVFAPTGQLNLAWTADGDEPVYISAKGFAQSPGYPELRPPFLEKDGSGNWHLEQWDFRRPPGATGDAPAQLIPRPSALPPGMTDAGLPIIRRGREHLPVAHLDGSARIESVLELARDMRRWAPCEPGLNPPPFNPDSDP